MTTKTKRRRNRLWSGYSVEFAKVLRQLLQLEGQKVEDDLQNMWKRGQLIAPLLEDNADVYFGENRSFKKICKLLRRTPHYMQTAFKLYDTYSAARVKWLMRLRTVTGRPVSSISIKALVRCPSAVARDNLLRRVLINDWSYARLRREMASMPTREVGSYSVRGMTKPRDISDFLRQLEEQLRRLDRTTENWEKADPVRLADKMPASDVNPRMVAEVATITGLFTTISTRIADMRSKSSRIIKKIREKL